MPTLTIGPLRLSRRFGLGAPVQHGPLHIVPVARVMELAWYSPRLTIVLSWVRPHHVQLRTLAGIRRITIRQRGAAVLPALGILAALIALGSIRLRPSKPD